MKNLKNKLATMALLGIMMVGTVSADPGIMLSDKSNTCTPTTVDVIEGIIVAGLAGILLGDRSGLLMSDKSATVCQAQSRDGILMSD